jgi:flavin reductase
MVTREVYRDAMARLGAAVSVITTEGPAGRHGFTASAVCSVTDDPPTLLVCMNRDSTQNAAFKRNQVLCVNTLTGGHEGLSAVFASKSDDPEAELRWSAASWGVLHTGSPVLQGAVVAFDCRIAQVTEVGTHSVFFCEVEAIAAGATDQGLIYFGRTYHRIGHAA